MTTTVAHELAAGEAQKKGRRVGAGLRVFIK